MISFASQSAKPFYPPQQSVTQYSGSKLIAAVRRERLGDVKKHLHDVAALTYVDPDGWSPLHLAAHSGNLSIIDALLAKMKQHGISVDIENQWKFTPLYNAIMAGRLAVVERLLEAGANANCTNDKGFSALHLAACNGLNKIVKVLLDNGADCRLINKDGETALLYAHNKGNKQVFSLVKPADEVATLYSRIVRQRKVLSHILGLGGKTILPHPSGDLSKKVTVPLTGWWHLDMWKLIVKRGRDFFGEASIIQETCRLATSNASWTMQEVLGRYKSGKPIIINTGFYGHYVAVMFWKDYAVICNRGAGNNRKTCEVVPLDPQKVTISLLAKLHSLRGKPENEYKSILNKMFPSRLIEPPPGGLFALLEKHLSLAWQEVENCTWANAEAAVFALLVLQEVMDGVFRPAIEFEKIVSAKRQEFQSWREFMIKAQVESYLRKPIKQITRLYTEDWGFLQRVETKASFAFYDNELNALKLLAAVREGRVENVRYLLAEEDTPLDYADANGDTALHYAAHWNRVKISKILLYHGANLARVNKMGETPLLQARKRGHKQVYRYLRSKDDTVLAYSKAVAKQKLLAGILGIDGIMTLANPNNSQVLNVVVPLAGWGYRDVWNQIVKHSRASESSAILVACKSAADDVPAENLLKQYRQDKMPILLNVGHETQHVVVVLWGPFFVICNRANVHQNTSAEVFNIKPDTITEEVICKLRSFQEKPLQGFLGFLNKKFPSRILPPQIGTRKALLEQHMSLPWQPGDCAWANCEGAMYALFILQGLVGRPNFPIAAQLHAIVKRQRENFDDWREHMIDAQVARLLKEPKNETAATRRYPRDWKFLDQVKAKAPPAVAAKIDRFTIAARDLLTSLNALDT